MDEIVGEDLTGKRGEAWVGFRFLRCRVSLDDNLYEDCSFVECQLIYRGHSLPGLSKCRFDATNFTLADEAENTLRFLADLSQVQNGGRELVTQFLAHILAGSVPSSADARPQGVTLQ